MRASTDPDLYRAFPAGSVLSIRFSVNVPQVRAPEVRALGVFASGVVVRPGRVASAALRSDGTSCLGLHVPLERWGKFTSKPCCLHSSSALARRCANVRPSDIPDRRYSQPTRRLMGQLPMYETALQSQMAFLGVLGSLRLDLWRRTVPSRSPFNDKQAEVRRDVLYSRHSIRPSAHLSNLLWQFSRKIRRSVPGALSPHLRTCYTHSHVEGVPRVKGRSCTVRRIR